MKALIFAAGLGERMRPLTDTTPKPLLHAGGKPLIVWHLEKLAAIGIRDVVVNTSWLAEQFPQALSDGSDWNLRLHFSYEGPTPLETGGGMWNALSLLRDDREPDGAFIAINGDIWTDYDFARLPQSPNGTAHLVLVDNPEHHPKGDFSLMHDAGVRSDAPPEIEVARLGDPGERLTFAGIGVYRPSLFDEWRRIIGAAAGADETPPRFKLAPLLREAMSHRADGPFTRISGERHRGRWTDVGTPERLAGLNAGLKPV